MSEQKNGFQNVIANIGNFFKNAVQQIKKGDKRFIIMSVAALVLVVILLALIIHGVSSGKTQTPPETVAPVGTTEDPTFAEPEPVNGRPGKYRVNTNSESSVNMRLAADRTSDRVTTIPHNTEVEVLFVDDSGMPADDYGWGYVDYNGKRGWVYMEYLVPVK